MKNNEAIFHLFQDMLTSSMQAGNEQIDRKCEECGFQGATKRHCFNTVPRILAIQLTRFNPDRSKDDQFVHFDHTLSLEVFCKQPAVAGTAKYRLYAVLNHFGDLNSGHCKLISLRLPIVLSILDFFSQTLPAFFTAIRAKTG
jgi:ubiquitin C-terminal hydrolase